MPALGTVCRWGWLGKCCRAVEPRGCFAAGPGPGRAGGRQGVWALPEEARAQGKQLGSQLAHGSVPPSASPLLILFELRALDKLHPLPVPQFLHLKVGR